MLDAYDRIVNRLGVRKASSLNRADDRASDARSGNVSPRRPKRRPRRAAATPHVMVKAAVHPAVEMMTIAAAMASRDGKVKRYE